MTLPGVVLAGGALAWAGALDSLLLWQQHAPVRDWLCPVKNGCDSVLASPFSQVGGLPIAGFGAAYYLSILSIYLVLIAVESVLWRKRLLEAALWLLVVGATFSAGLMYLQFFVIRSFCPLCTLSAVITGALIFVTVRAQRIVDRAAWAPARSIALTLGFFALLPAAILIGANMVAVPVVRPVRLDLALAQISGPREAPVQLVVFSDYQCSFCRELAPALQRIRTEFADRVTVAFRDYPLESHPEAFTAAVAAHCAGEQGRYWEYHDRLFREGGDFSAQRLISFAEALQLDLAQFEACLKSDRAIAAVRRSQEDAAANGLAGVPSVFLNGRQLQGKLSYERLSALIRDALEAAAQARKDPAP